MTKTYTIYSSSGFIGFCFVLRQTNYTQGGLSLFETISVNGNTTMYQQGGKHEIYNSTLSDIDIIKDLMQKSIPTLRTNGLTYSAVENNGTTHSI